MYKNGFAKGSSNIGENKTIAPAVEKSSRKSPVRCSNPNGKLFNHNPKWKLGTWKTPHDLYSALVSPGYYGEIITLPTTRVVKVKIKSVNSAYP